MSYFNFANSGLIASPTDCFLSGGMELMKCLTKGWTWFLPYMCVLKDRCSLFGTFKGSKIDHAKTTGKLSWNVLSMLAFSIIGHKIS